MSNNFTVKAENALNRAAKLAEDYGHTYIGTEHVLLAIAEDETCCGSILLRKCKIISDKIISSIKDYSGIGTPTKLSSKDTTPKCRKLLECSYKIAKKYGSEKIGTEHLLLAILEEKECVATKILIRAEADLVLIKDTIITFLRTADRGIVLTEFGNESSIPNLLRYGKNISVLAARGDLDPVIGREKETDRLIRILSRRSKNNPCLIGEAGVGKTAIVEGLARRIAEGSVPNSLLGKIIISLDLTSMVAGAKYRGDFEDRIKNIMSEASKNKSIILFIDEIHTIVGAGSAEGAIDAANIMKPELSRGNIQLIGATTLAEYRKYIEKDGALERRFQPLLVEEPNLEATVKILGGLKDRYESHHKVKIDNSALLAAASLSQRYIQDRFLPDKAIDLLDEACAMASLLRVFDNEKTINIKEKLRQISFDRRKSIKDKDFELAINLGELEKIYASELNDEIINIGNENEILIGEQEVEEILKEITGIDISAKSNISAEKIKSSLAHKIIGQDSAIESISNAIIRSYAGINAPNKPRGVFLFLGESGIGKTALAEALAEELFGTLDGLVRFDMSEYSESYSVSKFIGSAPGYVGYDEQNSPLEKIRKHPYSVILLDEIEKAHPDVLSLFLQIFDNGIITDAHGRKINFKNSYIVMTSNIGSDKFHSNNNVGFLTSADDENLQQKLKGYFREEFINRIDEIILFSPLSISALKQISKMKILSIIKRVESNNIRIKIEEEVYDHIANLGNRFAGFGARALNRIIVSEIENRIADMIVNKTLSPGSSGRFYIENGKINCETVCLALK